MRRQPVRRRRHVCGPGDPGEFATAGVYGLPKSPAAAIALDARVSWETTAKQTKPPPVGLYPVGLVRHRGRSARRHERGRGRGRGPRFLECRTYRFRAHSMFDPQLYRPKEEVKEWEGKGPILRFKARLLESGIAPEDDIARIEEAVAKEIEAAPAITATLAADHRVSDGHRGALFLRAIDDLLHKPEAL